MDLVINIDYQSIVKRLKDIRKTKGILTNTGHYDYGYVCHNVVYNDSGEADQINFCLEGDGPFYRLDNRTLRYALFAHPGFKMPKVGDTFWLGGLRLKIVDSVRMVEFIVMLPDTLSVLVYAILPISRWFDLIYRRLILTASVWNLANIEAGELPHWGHLEIVNRIQRKGQGE